MGVIMGKNLLLFDVGNTTTKVGLDGGAGMRQFSFRTDSRLTPDDIGMKLLFLLDRAGVSLESVEAAVVSSVVPGVDYELVSAVEHYVGCPVLFVPRDIPVPLENRYRNPREVGADRLVVSCAARMLFPDDPSLIVIDSGTALTFDCVSGGAYLGGLIFPGPVTALDALAGAAAKLPHISLETDAAVPEPGHEHTAWHCLRLCKPCGRPDRQTGRRPSRACPGRGDGRLPADALRQGELHRRHSACAAPRRTRHAVQAV